RSPHQLVQVLRIQPHHLRMGQQARSDEAQHGVAGGKQNFSLRLEGLGLQAMLERRPVLLTRDADISLKRRSTPPHTNAAYPPRRSRPARNTPATPANTPQT